MGVCILIFSVMWIVRGGAGLFGYSIWPVPKKYAGYSWTKDYVFHCCGVAWLILGIFWLALFLITLGKEVSIPAMALFLILASLPGVGYDFVQKRRFMAMRKE